MLERAIQDKNYNVRVASLEALARGWSQEDSTRELLRERALQDENEDVRRAAFGALSRGKVDRLALVLISSNLDGIAPFLDPLEPMPAAHLSKALKRLQLDEPTARGLLDSYNDILGWNLLDGRENA